MWWWTLILSVISAALIFRLTTRLPAWSEFDEKIRTAQDSFHSLDTQRTYSYDETVAAYRARRGRHPPAGFDRWYELANQTDAVIIESFWDLIYEDLEPFRAVPRAILSNQTSVLAQEDPKRPMYGFSIRNGILERHSCEPDNEPCLDLAAMLRTVAPYTTGDLYLPMNLHSSPRLIVPWDLVESLRIHARNNQYADWAYEEHTLERTKNGHTYGNRTSLWSALRTPREILVRAACPPASSIHNSRSNSVEWGLLSDYNGSEQRFEERRAVSDTRLARNVCEEPDLLHLHGAFFQPQCPMVSDKLVPVFAGARIEAVNHEIIFPDSLNWDDDPDYHAQSQAVPWEFKSKTAIWRGTNTGGNHSSSNWQQFHRHRFVAATNASKLKEAHDETTAFPSESSTNTFPSLFSLLGIQRKTAASLVPGNLFRQLLGHIPAQYCPVHELAAKHVDTAFTGLVCKDEPTCSYLRQHFDVRPHQPFDSILEHAYIFDVDGYSFSGRFRGLLLSGSVVIKDTIYREWHDTRLFPWVHYVPCRFSEGRDLWDVVRYFMGDCKGENRHDSTGQKIADAARQWAEKVLRKEDAQLYFVRLLIEWQALLSESSGQPVL